MLRPSEPIQLYSCPLTPPVAELWREESLLTDVLCDYIKRFGIARIIDLTAIDAYRQLIDWERIAATKTDVLHCFDEMADGESALTSFGKCMATELLGLSEKGIVDLPSDHRIGTVILRSLAETVPGLPTVRPEVEPAEVSPESPPTQASTHARLPCQLTYSSRFRGDVHKHMGELTRICQPTLDICRDPTTPRERIKRLKGQQGRWRYRFGDYRIIYSLDKDEGMVVLERLRHRKDAFRS